MLIAAFATFLLACMLYSRARFLYAGLTGFVLAGLLGVLLFDSFDTVTAVLLAVVLLLIPAGFVIVHAVDVRKGIFLLPTIYGIAVGFLGVTLCLLITAAARLLAL